MCGCVCKYYTRCASSTSWINLSQMMSPYQYIYLFYIFTYNSNTNFSLAYISMCMHTYASQCGVCLCMSAPGECLVLTSSHLYIVCMYISIYLAAKSILLGPLWNWYNLLFFILWCGQLTETLMRKDFENKSDSAENSPLFYHPRCSDRLSLYLCGFKWRNRRCGSIDMDYRRQLKPKSGWMTMVVRRPSKALSLSPLIKSL